MSVLEFPSIQDLEFIATGRKASLFNQDFSKYRKELLEGLRGSRVAVIGAAGSIGSSVLRSLLEFQPRCVVLFDLSENLLVEIVRELRSTRGLRLPEDFQALPIGLGSVEFNRYFAENPDFDYWLNLSALKHVRSEKDIYSLMRLIHTNVIYPFEFLRAKRRALRKVFSVSSDKAVNPANLMGASKLIMEQVLNYYSDIQPVSSARFANVAFSFGSLPCGFLDRIRKGQTIAGPSDVRRYFISHREAGELCVLSAVLGKNRDIFFPLLDGRIHEKSFESIAEGVLSAFGYEAYRCASEAEAMEKFSELRTKRKWPIFFSPSDTTGEKDLEEFYTGEDKLDRQSFREIGVVKTPEPGLTDRFALENFIKFVEVAREDSRVGKAEVVLEMRKLVPGLRHVEKNRNLDQKM